MRTGYAVTGTASLTIDATTTRLELSTGVSIGQDPGPTLYRNTQSNPNAGQTLRIGALRIRSGAQSYTFQVPHGVRYSHAIAWCDPFNVPMAEATIPPNRSATRRRSHADSAAPSHRHCYSHHIPNRRSAPDIAEQPRRKR
jgi:hypothetical protein